MIQSRKRRRPTVSKLLLPLVFLFPLVMIRTHAGFAPAREELSEKELGLDQARLANLIAQKGVRDVAFSLTCDQLKNDIRIPMNVSFHFISMTDRGFLQDGTEMRNYGIGGFLPHPTKDVRAYLRGAEKSRADFTSVADMITTARNQVAYLNDKFSDTPFDFQLVSTDVYEQNDWATFPLDYKEVMSSSLSAGDDLRTMNVYVTYNVESHLRPLPQEALGYSSFASEQSFKTGDGIIIRYDTLIGGGYPKFDNGITLVHEAGHWLGLYHPFRKSNGDYEACSDDNRNDFVEDTNSMSRATIYEQPDCMSLGGDESLVDSCPGANGNDPVFNYMNYLDDGQCYEDHGYFTCEQIQRMYFQYKLYRDDVEICGQDELELEIFIQFDRFHADENVIILQDSSGAEIFNSREDYYDGAIFAGEQDSLSANLCVRNEDYDLVVIDTYGDGFDTGFVEVRQEGVTVGRIEGAFGAGATLAITKPATITTGGGGGGGGGGGSNNGSTGGGACGLALGVARMLA